MHPSDTMVTSPASEPAGDPPSNPGHTGRLRRAAARRRLAVAAGRRLAVAAGRASTRDRPGELLEGREAEVFAAGDGTVLKLLRDPDHAWRVRATRPRTSPAPRC